MPGGPPPDLVLVERGEFLARLEIIFDRPTNTSYPDKSAQRDAGRALGAVERVLAVADAPADHQVVAALQVAVGHLDDRPVVEPLSFGAVTCGDAVPGMVGQGDGNVDRLLRPGLRRDRFTFRDGEDVAGPATGDRGPQTWVRPVDLVSGDPVCLGACVERPFDHPLGELGLRREREILGCASGRASRRVVHPRLRHVQSVIDKGVPDRGRVGQIDRDLRVFDSPGGSGVLPLNTDGSRPLFQVSRLIDDEHALGVAECLGDVVTKIGTKAVVVHHGLRQEVLHRPWPALTRVLGECPTVDPL